MSCQASMPSRRGAIIGNQFSYLHISMNGMPYQCLLVTDGKCEQIQFIDTSPWQEFPVMHRLYVRTCELVVIAYDVTSKTWKESLTNMIKEIKEIKGERMESNDLSLLVRAGNLEII